LEQMPQQVPQQMPERVVEQEQALVPVPVPPLDSAPVEKQST
jgi:hypothetical protein